MSYAKGPFLAVLLAFAANGCVVHEHTHGPPREEVRVKEVRVDDHHDHHDHDHHDHDEHHGW